MKIEKNAEYYNYIAEMGKYIKLCGTCDKDYMTCESHPHFGIGIDYQCKDYSKTDEA